MTTPHRLAGSHIAVLGGGVAGIAAAVRLAEVGAVVTLLEKRRLLGGRASSFIDRETGERLDACQHITMGCCTALADLLLRLQVAHQMRWHRTLEFVDSSGHRSSLTGGLLPAPLHMAAAFLRFGALRWKHRLETAGAMLAALRSEPGTLDGVSAAEWLGRVGVSEDTADRFLGPLLASACNMRADELSAEIALKVVRDGFLTHRHAYLLGIPAVPLASLFTEPASAFLGERGGSIRLGATVDRVLFADGRACGAALVGGEVVRAEAILMATPFDRVARLLRDAPVGAAPYLPRLRHAPIIGVHVRCREQVGARPAVALLGMTFDWVFNRSANLSEDPARGSRLSLVVSAKPQLASLERRELLDRALADLRVAAPDASPDTVIDWHVIKERHATFAAHPGVDAIRPEPGVLMPGLALAGEWTRTGWPSTMEGAVRSGYAAAEALARGMGADAEFTVPDLPTEWPARLLGARRSATRTSR